MDLMTELTIFVLAAFVGFAVISKVPTTLHTPLMSQTNAIHGIVMLGGLIVAGFADGALEQTIAFIAIAFGTINIVGGFMVTDRMLGMFVRKPKPKRRSRGARSRERSPCSSRAATPRPRSSTSSRSRSSSTGSCRARTRRPRRHGNLIAAGGMAIAVVTTLLLDGIGNWGVIVGGLAVGSAVGVVASTARADDRDAADGRALQRRRRRRRGADRLVGVPPRDSTSAGEIPLDELIPILFAAVIGSVSFWGSNIAFAKLQDLIPTRPLAVPGPAGDQRAAAGRDPRRLRRARRRQRRRPLGGPVHRRADRRGAARQPRRAADRRRRHAGGDLAAERVHRALGRGGRLLARQRRR